MTERPKMHDTMMATALIWAARSTCSRLSVGAVLATQDQTARILATGYNGAPRGIEHCVHASGDDSCTAAVHAEVNVVANAAYHGSSTRNARLYCTHAPCRGCASLIINAGITQVYYGQDYKNFDGIMLLSKARIATRLWPVVAPLPRSVS